MVTTDRMGWPDRLLRRSTNAAARSCAAALVLLLTSCGDLGAPPGPPYLAIVTDLSAWPGADAPSTITYHVRELSGSLSYDRRVVSAAHDTIILSVPPATYRVDAVGLPPRCVAPGGAERGIIVGEGDNTGIIRFPIECRGLVSVTALTDGWDADAVFTYRVRDPLGAEQVGTLAANDTVVVSDGPGGEYEVRLAGVAPNCTITSDGGGRRTVLVDPLGGAEVSFRVSCSETARRPRILDLRSSYVLGSNAFHFRVADPDGDVDGYVWDITDCAGSSILPDRRERTRRGLRSGRGGLSDTLVVVGAYDVGLSAADLIGRCTEIRVFDVRQNVSAIATHRIGPPEGYVPSVRFFDARLVGTTHIQTLLEASDPESDIVGHFVAVRLRDGVLGAPDGKPDIGILDAAGGLGTIIPNIPTSGRIAWDDVNAVIVWVVDRRGNAVRVEDTRVLP